jgi:hypothetical protein
LTGEGRSAPRRRVRESRARSERPIVNNCTPTTRSTPSSRALERSTSKGNRSSCAKGTPSSSPPTHAVNSSRLSDREVERLDALGHFGTTPGLNLQLRAFEPGHQGARPASSDTLISPPSAAAVAVHVVAAREDVIVARAVRTVAD